MPRRTAPPVVVAVALVLAALGYVVLDVGRPGGDDGPTPAPSSQPSASSEPSAETAQGPVALADAVFEVGPPEIVMGPTPDVDSYLTAVEVDGRVRAYVGRGDTRLLEGDDVTDLAPTEREAIRRGDDAFDRCGAWLDAVLPDPRDPGLLRGWYHAEGDCIYREGQTRKSIAYAESRDAGLTFTKPGYPRNQVVRASTDAVAGERTGRGDFTVLRRGRFYYLYYLDVRPDFSTVTSVARAPVRSGGLPGTWRNYTGAVDGDQAWTADALGGPAAALDTAPPASSASTRLPTGEVMLVRQSAPDGGIVLQVAADGISFEPLAEPIVPYLRSQVRSDWRVVDDTQIFGYVSVVGPDGSREWTDTFHLFHMYVFPGGDQRTDRFLVRREVTVSRAEEDAPRSTVALTRWVDSGADGGAGDRFDTTAPVQSPYVVRDVVASLFATPAPDRAALFECTSPDGGHFVGRGCGTASEGRLVGYAALSELPGSVELVRCATRSGDQFASVDEECEGRGRRLSTLGWVLPPP